MRVLITGGGGYVGTTLTPMLLDAGHEVTVFDLLMFGGDPLLPFFRRPGFQFIKGDVRDEGAVRKAVAACDAVIHLAAIVGYPACRKDPLLAESTNVTGTKNVAGALAKDQLLLFASTGSTYGQTEELCTEESPINPLSLYGQTKERGEILVRVANGIIYRFATAFGVSPRLRLDLLPNDFTHKCLTQGYLVVYERHYMRTFIHVHDMARAFMFGLEHAAQMRGDIYNVGSEDMNYSKQQVCEIIKSFVPSTIHYDDFDKDQDQRNYVVKYDKIKRLGYVTTIDMKQGVEELVRALPVVMFRTPYTNI